MLQCVGCYVMTHTDGHENREENSSRFFSTSTGSYSQETVFRPSIGANESRASFVFSHKELSDNSRVIVGLRY